MSFYILTVILLILGIYAAVAKKSLIKRNHGEYIEMVFPSGRKGPGACWICSVVVENGECLQVLGGMKNTARVDMVDRRITHGHDRDDGDQVGWPGGRCCQLGVTAVGSPDHA